MECLDGNSALGDMYLQMDVEHLFSDYPSQRSEFEEFFASERWHPSSPSSSWRSFSTGSPEFSSLVKSGSLSSIPDGCHDVEFPTFTSDDAVIMNAMSSMFSLGSSSSSPVLHRSPGDGQTNRNVERSHSGFKPYHSAIPPRSVLNKKSCGQKMIKDSIAFLRKIDTMKSEDADRESPSSRTQLHHVMSERKRREKLNESFHALRQLLPPCSKKDKAAVLCRTKDYLKTLEAQIFNLEKNNQMLEMHLAEAGEDVSVTIGGIDLQIIEALEPMIGVRRINLKITVRIECDLLELTLHALEYLKEMRAISLVSVDASSYLQKMALFTWVTLTFDIKAANWDEASFKVGMIRAVENATISL